MNIFTYTKINICPDWSRTESYSALYKPISLMKPIMFATLTVAAVGQHNAPIVCVRIYCRNNKDGKTRTTTNKKKSPQWLCIKQVLSANTHSDSIAQLWRYLKESPCNDEVHVVVKKQCNQEKTYCEKPPDCQIKSEMLKEQKAVFPASSLAA